MGLRVGRGSGEGAADCPVRGPVVTRLLWSCRRPDLELRTCAARSSLGFAVRLLRAGRSPRGLVTDGAKSGRFGNLGDFSSVGFDLKAGCSPVSLLCGRRLEV